MGSEEIELNNITTLTDDTYYCCICLNTFDYDFTQLQCCNQALHQECAMDWILTENNTNYKCPNCRKKIQLHEKITFGTFIDYIDKVVDKDINKDKVITKNKICSLISNLYSTTYIKNILIDDSSPSDLLQENLVEIHNNKIKILFLSIVLITSIIIIFMYVYISLQATS